MTGTYDPDLNLVYVGTGNPTPVLNGDGASRRQPVDLQHRRAQSRHRASSRGASRRRRTTRTTGTPPKCRCWSTATSTAQPRKMLMQASRNGYFFVLDRTNGKNLLTDAVRGGELGEGHRREGPADSESRRRSRRATAVLVAPNEGGAHQLPVAELRSEDRPVHRQRRRTATASTSSSRSTAHYGWAGADYGVCEQGRAPRASTTRPARSVGARPIGGGGGAGVLTTASGLTFTGDAARQRARAAHQRRHDAVALDHRPGRQWPDHLRARRQASTCSSAAGACSTRGRCRRRRRYQPAR